MIVCSCNVLSDHEVRNAVATAAPRTTGQVYGCLGCSAECGGCARTIETVTAVWTGLTPGLHRYWVKVDSGQEIVENSEGDNVASGYVLVNPEQAFTPLIRR